MYAKLLAEEIGFLLRQAMTQKSMATRFAVVGSALLLVTVLISLARFTLSSFSSGRYSSAAGAVTLAGQPLARGSIMFVPDRAAAAALTGGEVVSGRYSVKKNLEPGAYRVEIRSPRPSQKPLRVAPSHQGPPLMSYEEAISSAFNTQTTLRVSVEQGANRFDFRVEAAPKE